MATKLHSDDHLHPIQVETPKRLLTDEERRQWLLNEGNPPRVEYARWGGVEYIGPAGDDARIADEMAALVHADSEYIDANDNLAVVDQPFESGVWHNKDGSRFIEMPTPPDKPTGEMKTIIAHYE